MFILQPLEQRMLYGAGGVVLGRSLCALGPGVCTASLAILAAATIFVNEKGICPGRLEVKNGTVAKCV